MRENHALEHATINVLEQRFSQGPVFFVGRARPDGFYLRGPGNLEMIEDAAGEALRRLSAGEGRLALRRQCGTSIFAANLLLSAVVLFILLGLGRSGPLEVLLWLAAANLAGPIFGRLVQSHLTTSRPGAELSIRRVVGQPVMAGFLGRVASVAPMDLFVETGRGPAGVGK
ncbi:MAG: DUF6391 domain-containing protein [Bacillota bacterium]